MGSIVEINFEQVEKTKEISDLIEKVVQACYEKENLWDCHVMITITITTPENIRKLNKQYRNMDRATDVLSFPMFEKQEIEKRREQSKVQELIEDILGDIVISKQQVEWQAKEYQHSFQRELAYMVVHGFYHLMGYDHMEEQEKLQMRQKEEEVLQNLNIIRNSQM